MSSLNSIFGPTPVTPVQQHMLTCFLCAAKLEEFFKAVIEQNWDDAYSIQSDISNLEVQADKLKKDIKLKFPNSFFLPIPRRDLLNLVDCQDRVANKAEDVAGIVLGRKIKLHESLQQEFLELVQAAISTAKQANQIIKKLNHLINGGFNSKEVSQVTEMIVQLDELESEADKKERIVRQALFALESEMPAIEVIFLYKLIEWTGDVADRAQNVGAQMILLLAR